MTLVIIGLLELKPAVVFGHGSVAELGTFAKIELPSGTTLERSSERMPDFLLYYVNNMKKNILGVYIGNAPDIDPKKLTKTYDFDGCEGRISDDLTGTGRNLDAVLELKGAAFPKFIHFFSRGLSDNEASDVYLIWHNFRIVNGRICIPT